MGNGVISLLWQLRCHCNPDYNQFSSLSNITVVSIFPNPCLWRRSLRSNLGGIDLEKLHRATLTGFLKELRNPFACDADHRFDNKIKCPTGRASFSVEFPTVRSKTPVKCPGHALVRGLGGGEGGWAVFELTGTWNGEMSHESNCTYIFSSSVHPLSGPKTRFSNDKQE